jgi:hypothetical protein
LRPKAFDALEWFQEVGVMSKFEHVGLFGDQDMDLRATKGRIDG